MATTAHAAHNLEISAPDDMDLHSDSGLDFGDGDIDLDLEPAPSVLRQDDDVSINDAASAGGLDVQTVPPEEDDFMADHEDFIEEDYRYEGGDDIVAAEQPPENNTASAQIETMAPPDDDLIDYSEDEGEQTQKEQAVSLQHDDFEVQDAQDEVSPVDQDNLQDYDQGYQAANAEGVDLDSQPGSQDDRHSEAHNEENDHTDGEDGGVRLQGHGDLDDEDEYEDSEHDVPHEDSDHATNAADNEHQDDQSFGLQPVTVNYAGNELWLFKHHDTDDSGDWLLENLSLAKSSMSDLFQACRSSLGDDVSNEHEIGFRFDHLHNLELYEDNTACVAVSLERLVGLYHTLQEQDGNNEPESFYMSLLFRPRFATLLSDVAKYAEQGSGYSGLDAAVAAGETHFSNTFSGSSTEHEPNEWENEDQEEEDHDDTEQTNDQAQQEGDPAEHEERDPPQTHANSDKEQDQEEDDEDDNEGTSADDAFHQEQDLSNLEHDASLQSANSSDVPTNQQGPVGQVDAQIPLSQKEDTLESDERREQQENDLIEYSDDDGPEDTEQVEHASANEPSASSSTVQGDGSTTVEEGADTVTLDQNDQGNENNDELDLHAEDVNENQFNDQLVEGIDDTTQSYQNYDQAFGQDDPFQGFQANGDANQDYAGFEYNSLDQQLQLDFMNGAEFNAGDASNMTRHDFTSTDDFLDLNNAPEWVTDQAPASNVAEDVVIVHDDTTAPVDEEDGPADHPAAAVSSIATPTAASTGFQKSSPQGQKRSIDEAGHGGDDALDPIDAKRPKV